jgi:uncharacterized RDD family membrane protein YckC
MTNSSAATFDRPNARAGVVSRGVAFFLDALGTFGAVVGAFAVIGILGTVLRANRLLAYSHVDPATFSIIVSVTFLLYCAATWRVLGRTFGQALFGLRVVRTDGGVLKTPACVLRAACFLLSAIMLVGFIWIIFDSRRQGFHDKIARSVVIYDWPREPSAAPSS